MKHALIDGGRICQFVASEGERFPVYPTLRWVEVPDDTTEQDAYIDGAVVKAEVAVVQPAPLDGLTFLARLSPQEYATIIVTAHELLTQGNGQLSFWIDMLRLRGSIDLSGADAQGAKAALVAGSLLTQERADAIFALN